MKLFLIILTFFILKSNLVQSLSQEIIEDIFYGETPLLKENEINKIKEEMQTSSNEFITISNIKQYLKQNDTNFENFTKVTKPEGNCSKLISIDNSMYSKRKYFKQNIKILNSYLNEKNYLFNDPEGNIIVYSTCSNFLNVNCVPHFFFISKL